MKMATERAADLAYLCLCGLLALLALPWVGIALLAGPSIDRFTKQTPVGERS